MTSFPPLSETRQKQVRSLHNLRNRERSGEVLIEGPRALAAACEASVLLRFVVVDASAGARLGALGDIPSASVFSVDSGTFKSLATTQTPQGLLGVAKVPDWNLSDISQRLTWESGPVLILDGIQDPGNVGTLLRSAVAMGAVGVIALDGTADPWSPKVIRAAAGENFKIPVVQASWTEVEPWVRETGVSLWVASAEGQDVRTLSARATFPHSRGLVLGNEGQGPRVEVRAAADRLVGIPLHAGVESLNAAQAGTILLWALGPGQGPPSRAV